MARVPVITSPCPLRFNTLPSAGRDFCGQCRRRVHDLDGMSEAQRTAFFASCSGEVCVAYTVRRPAALASAFGFGVAAASALAATPATEPQGAAAQIDTTAVVQTGPTCDPNAKGQALEWLVVGGTTRAAQWVDDSEIDVPDRPEIAEIGVAEWLPTPTSK